MKANPKSKPSADTDQTPEWLLGADRALERAADRAWEIARQTNTCLHVMVDGKIVTVRPRRKKKR